MAARQEVPELKAIAPVTLTGRFVRLEPLTARHVPALKAAAADPSIFLWMNARDMDGDGMATFVGDALAAERAGTAIPFATVLLSEERVIGSTRYLNIAPRDSRLEIGATWIGAPWQRTAVNTEAKYLMLRHAFEVMCAVRVELKTNELNMKSRRAMERIGAQFEGVHRKHMAQLDGSRRNSAWYSILDDEWPGVKARLEQMLARN